MTLDERVRTAFAHHFGGEPAGVVRAPGRVNLIGEHTDYNGGFVLPCAIGVETRISWRRRDDDLVRVLACDIGAATDTFHVTKPLALSNTGDWRAYVRGMFEASRLARIPLAGVDLAISGNIPLGSGLSSSASLTVAVGHAILLAAGRSLPDIYLAQLAQSAENDHVGMRCGIMDQMASAAGVDGAALLIDCSDLTTKAVRMPQEATILIIESGVVRGLVAGHYNRRRAECEEAASAMGVPTLRDADLAMLRATEMGELPRSRARHIITENARVLAAASALERDDLVAVGALMAASHASMRDDFQITVAKVDELATTAQRAIGEEGGARMTGGGFGGAVVALVRSDRVSHVANEIRSQYRTPNGNPPVILVERAASGAGSVA